jgi:DNA-binding MarR family transcriptional regulator
MHDAQFASDPSTYASRIGYSEPEPGRLANRLGALALHLTDLMTDATRQAAGRGATAPAALTALSRHRRRPIEYLRRVLGLSHPATVRVVDRLSEDGLVRREPGPDGRTVAPTLTPAGEQAAERVATARLAVLADVLAALDPAERQQLERLVDKLVAAAAPDDDAGVHLCRLCDLPVCERDGACPVDVGLLARGRG